MVAGVTALVSRQLKTASQKREEAATDGSLLGRFVVRRDPEAFAFLVRRHGPMVWAACRRLLGHHDAEEAFQATFLVLARKAASIVPREMLANWLYGVAHQASLQLRRTVGRRTRHERQVGVMGLGDRSGELKWNDLRPVLDQELSALPEKYRAVLVLCDLESRTRKEVALQLKCPEGTVAGRLARARRMLAVRLTRRGIRLSLAALSFMLAEHAIATPPGSVLAATFKVALDGNVPISVATLAEGVLKMLALTKLRTLATVALIVAVCLGALGFTRSTDAASWTTRTEPATMRRVPVPRQGEAKPDPKDLLRRASEACKQVRAIDFTEEQGRVGEPPTVTALVREARANVKAAGFGPGLYSFDIQIKDQPGKPRRLQVAYDGNALRCIDDGDADVLVLNDPDERLAGSLAGRVRQPLVGCGFFLREKPLGHILDHFVSATYHGTRDVLGTDCHVVEAVWTRDDPFEGNVTVTSTLFFGKNDLLYRGTEYRGQLTQYRILRVNDPAISTDFSLAAPAGRAEKKITGLEPRTENLLPVGAPAPDWTLPGADGKEHSLKDYRGKVVVLDFWGTWCVPCRKAMPGLQELHEKYKDKGLVVLGLAVQDQEGKPADYMGRMKFTYGLLLKGERAAKDYKAMTLPTIYVIGPDGKILHGEFGYRDKAKEELLQIIEKALRGVGK